MELQGRRIAVLVVDQYEDMELWYPVLRLREADAEVVVVGTEADTYASKHGLPVRADASVEQVDAMGSAPRSPATAWPTASPSGGNRCASALLTSRPWGSISTMGPKTTVAAPGLCSAW